MLKINQNFKKNLYFTTSVLLMGFLLGILSHGPAAQASFLDRIFGRSPNTGQILTPSPIIKYESRIDYETAIVKAVEESAPAVISIIISKDLPVIENCPYDPFSNIPPEFRDFFGGGFSFNRPCQKGTKRQEIGGGSGFIVSPDGLILTNKHVVSDKEAEYTILANDGKKYAAKVLARDPVQDLALVKFVNPPANLKSVRLGNSESLKLGQTVIAIGNALGEFRNTVSQGIVSGLSRNITANGGGSSERIEGLIQTDAAINPGNSGGPLLNLHGEVIGINTAVAEGAQNIGFAIPINKAKHDIDSVKSTGSISAPYLGVRYIEITPELAEKEKLPASTGVIVRGNSDGPGVIPDSPAGKAGILAEDIILEVNGEKISAETSLSNLVQKYQPGQTIVIKLNRQKQNLQIRVVLGAHPE